MSVIVVNSLNRLSGRPGDFTYEMKINEPYDRICLLQASIPKSYYLIDETNDNFSVRLDDGKSDIKITLEHGNYSVTTFMTELTNKLNTLVGNGHHFTITFSRKTGLFTYTVNDNHNPSFIFTDQLYEQLGFEANSTNTFVSQTLVSKNVVNMMSEDTLLIHSDAVAALGSNNVSDVLGEIFSSSTVDFGHTSFQCPDPYLYSRPLRTNTSGIFRFSVTDENNRPIIIRGGNVVLSILLFKDYPKIANTFYKASLFSMANPS